MNPTLRPDPPATATCAWCGTAFEIPQRPGPTPRYCKASHRQRAHEARRAATLTGPHDLATLAAAHHNTTTVTAGPRPDWRHAFLTLADAVAVATTITATPTPTSPQPARHPTEPRPEPRPPKPGRSAPADTIYECPSCEQRYLGERRCGDCNTFCRRIGPGGLCPHCDAPVAQQDLANH